MDDTTKMLAGGIIALWGALAGCVGVIRHLYADANAKLERRIEKMEEREEERNRATARYLEALERSLDLFSRQTSVTEEVARSVPLRRPRGGD